MVEMDAAGRWVRSVGEALGEGGLVVLPTDTVYGLAAALSNPEGPERIFEAKRRPTGVALAVLVSGIAQAEGIASGFDGPLGVLAERFWPGALTLVLPRRPGQAAALGGDGATIGLRCPADAALRSLCDQIGPVVATSANLHGRPPCSSASEAAEAFGEAVALVVDGGVRPGPSSTVVAWREGKLALLREGPLSSATLLAAIHDDPGRLV